MKAEHIAENSSLEEVTLILAVFSVDGATAACATHGDRATVGLLTTYYERVSATLAPAAGQVLKVMGDGLVAVFPLVNPKFAETACRRAQSETTALWQTFDARCRVRVKLGAGSHAMPPRAAR